MEKVILPSAMNCGCGYELFWKLNPRRLEAFFEAKRLKVKDEITMQDSFAWLMGTYTRDAVLSAIKHGYQYPRQARGLNQDDEFYEDDQNHDTESTGPKKKLSDGQNFALFMVKHNKALNKKRAKKNNA